LPCSYRSAEDPRVPPKLRNQMVKGANFYIPFAFDLRRPDEQQLTYPPRPRPAWQTSWMKVKGKMSDSPFLHQCALAYLSDWDLLRTSALPHGLQWGTKGVVTASLDHTYVMSLPSSSFIRLLHL
jgi:acyl-CoA thioesterase-2